VTVDLLDWDAVTKSEIDKLSRRDAALGVVPVLALIEPSGDMRVVSPFGADVTSNLLACVVQGLRRKSLQ